MERVETVEQAMQHESYRNALVQFLFQVADDELIMGHRDSEWLGIAPAIEEDVAFSSIAQDEVGHATYFYHLLEDLQVGDSNRLAFERPSADRQNATFVERPNGDWAETVLRHLFYDVFEQVRLGAMVDSSYAPLSFGARKMQREEHYHLLHMEMWVRRLSHAGGEALTRMQQALSVLWNEVGSLFAMDDALSQALVANGILTQSISQIRDSWLTRISDVLRESGLIAADQVLTIPAGSRSSHTLALAILLETMAEVHELDRSATW